MAPTGVVMIVLTNPAMVPTTRTKARGKTVHGEAANAGHRVLAPDDAEVEAYLETALNAPAPDRSQEGAAAEASATQRDTVAVLDFGSQFAQLPAWAAAWRTVDPALLTITDLNFDGIVQLAEIAIGGDIIVLATPEIAGLPYVVSGLVAAGGLAAALSTADGLLLTIANALGHDLYYKMIAPSAPTARRVTVSKVLLLVVALTAAWVTSYKPGNILFLVGAAFSFAASAFFPALVLGIFWKRANKWGAICGMAAGLGVCMYYMFTTYPFFRDVFGITRPVAEYMWFGMAPISAGVFGVPVGIVTIIVVSLLTREPEREVQELVEHVRYPNLVGDIDTRAT